MRRWTTGGKFVDIRGLICHSTNQFTRKSGDKRISVLKPSLSLLISLNARWEWSLFEPIFVTRSLIREIASVSNFCMRLRSSGTDELLGHSLIFLVYVQLVRSLASRRSSIRLLHQTGRTRRRRNSFACRIAYNWNRLPFAVASVTEQCKFKQQLDSFVPSRSVNTYIHTIPPNINTLQFFWY